MIVYDVLLLLLITIISAPVVRHAAARAPGARAASGLGAPYTTL